MKDIKWFANAIDNALTNSDTELYVRKDNCEDKLCYATSFGLEWDTFINRLKWEELYEQEKRGILEIYSIGKSIALEWTWMNDKKTRYIFTLKRTIPFS